MESVLREHLLWCSTAYHIRAKGHHTSVHEWANPGKGLSYSPPTDLVFRPCRRSLIRFWAASKTWRVFRQHRQFHDHQSSYIHGIIGGSSKVAFYRTYVSGSCGKHQDKIESEILRKRERSFWEQLRERSFREKESRVCSVCERETSFEKQGHLRAREVVSRERKRGRFERKREWVLVCVCACAWRRFEREVVSREGGGGVRFKRGRYVERDRERGKMLRGILVRSSVTDLCNGIGSPPIDAVLRSNAMQGVIGFMMASSPTYVCGVLCSNVPLFLDLGTATLPVIAPFSNVHGFYPTLPVEPQRTSITWLTTYWYRSAFLPYWWIVLHNRTRLNHLSLCWQGGLGALTRHVESSDPQVREQVIIYGIAAVMLSSLMFHARRSAFGRLET